MTSRRRFLRTAGTIGALGAVTNVSTTPAAADVANEYGSRFDDVVDIAAEGADRGGDEPIGEYLDAYAADDTLLVFPSGEYLMTEQFRHTGYVNLGIVGRDATIVPGEVEELDGNSVVEGEFSGPTRLFRLGVHYDPGSRLLMEGLTFDYTAENCGFRAIEAYSSDNLVVRDVTIEGEHDLGTFGPALFSVVEPDGIVEVERFRAPDGGAYSEDTIGDIWQGPTGILVPPSHKGKVRFRDCELGGFPDQGIYGSSTEGRVIVEGGEFRNSNSANIRLMADYSYVKHARIVVDDPDPGHNQRGIRLDAGKHLWVYDTVIDLSDPNGHAITVQDDVEKARIQDTEITVGHGEYHHGIDISDDAGAVDVFDTEISHECSGQAIYIDGENDASDDDVFLLRTHVDGSGPGGDGRNAIRCMRRGVRFEDVTCYVDGDEGRQGMEIHGDDCEIDAGRLEATEKALVVVGDDLYVDDLVTLSYSGDASVHLNDDSVATFEDCALYGGYTYDDGAAGDFVDTTYPDY